MSQRKLLPSLRPLYDFRSDVLGIIISGRSVVDFSSGLDLKNMDEVHRFVRSYGYELENPIEKAEVMGNFHEALNFLRRHFLQPENPDGLKVEIPRKILELTDVADLFLMASQHYPGQTHDAQGVLLQNWACSILKVMHTIAHIDKDLRTPYFLDIQMQILDRFYKVVHRDADGHLYLGDKDVAEQRSSTSFRLDLVAFETKPKKSRDSIILKLLHKPENVAEDIFDRVGIRFVTETTLDAVRVVKFLKDRMIVMPPNIKPSRSRNTLVDIEDFTQQLAVLLPAAERGEMTEQEFLTRLREAAHPPRVSPDNPHTSEFYRAIQFTCRQLIKLRNPVFDVLKDLKGEVKGKAAYSDLQRITDRIDLAQVQREVRFFYPYEIQVFDRLSAEENEKGRSAHSEYKRAQVQTAMKRVLGVLADVAR